MGSSGSKGSSASTKRSSSKSTQITDSDRVKLQLKVQRDSLLASIRKYERVGDSEHEKAKEFMKAGNKRRALYCLKRERQQQDQVKNVTNILDNVQKLIDTVEFAQIENEVVAALADGKTELDRLNKMLNIDDIEKLMNETTESVELAQQIDKVLSQPLANNVDNDDLLEELKEQVKEDTPENTLDEVKVPAHEVPAADQEKQENTLARPTRVLEAA